MKQNNSGITLIALVITVIVIMILAGVSLNMISGGDGIIGKASKAVTETQVAALKEEMNMAMTELKTDYFEKLNKGQAQKGFATYLKKICQENGDIYAMLGNRKVFLDNGVLWYIASNEDKAKIIVDSIGSILIKEIITKDGLTQDFTTEESLTQEAENAIKELEKEYKEKNGEEGSEDVTFKDFIKDKIENSGGYIETENGGKISLDNNGNIVYTDSSSTTNSANITFDENGKAQVENPTINDESSENIYPVIALTPENTSFKYEIEGEEITNTTWTNKSITITAIPNIDITGYKIQTSTNGLKWSNTATQTLTENGNMYVRLWNGSKAGGVATASVGTIEKTAPTVNITDSTINSITFTASDTKGTNEDVSEVAGYIVQESEAVPSATSSEWTAYDGSSITVNVEKQNTTYFVWVKDKAGNVSSYGTATTGRQPVTQITIVPDTISIAPGETVELTTTVDPSNAFNNQVIWNSEDLDIATVSQDGVVTAVSSGTTKITATAQDGSGIKGNCIITVKIPTYTVTYNSNGGTETPESQTKNIGESINISSTVPTRKCYTFTGWKVGSTILQPGEAYNGTENITLVAQWSGPNHTWKFTGYGCYSYSSLSSGYYECREGERVLREYYLDFSCANCSRTPSNGPISVDQKGHSIEGQYGQNGDPTWSDGTSWPLSITQAAFITKWNLQ